MHVLDRVDRDARAPDLAEGARVVRVEAELRRQVERRAEPGLAALEEEAETLVRDVGRAEAGVLAHRPRPRPVAVRAHAARERERAGRPELALRGAIGGDGDRDAGLVRALVGGGHTGIVRPLGRRPYPEGVRIDVRLFAALRERAGASRLAIELPDGARAGDVWARLGLGDEPAGLAVAVNRAYADRATALADGDEVAFIPPVSGGAEQAVAPRVHVRMTGEPLALAACVAIVEHPGAGAICTFAGTVRDRSRGKDVEHLDYESFDEMAAVGLDRIARAAALRHGLLAVAVEHRSGRVAIGETSVVIAVASAHRGAAFDGCREIIEELKVSVPIWKKEHYADGAEWIGRGS